jgi:uncharacterized membrane protein
MMAVGISKVIGKTLDLMALVELISGVVLIIIGSRAIRSVKSSDDFSAKSNDKQ